jgi:hypothetical protein
MTIGAILAVLALVLAILFIAGVVGTTWLGVAVALNALAILLPAFGLARYS